MNQLVGKDENGRPMLVLVLEPGNIHKLVEERLPIQVRVEDLFPEGIPRKLTLVIAHSETPDLDAKAFKAVADVTLDERTPKNANRRPHCPQCRSTIEQLGVVEERIADGAHLLRDVRLRLWHGAAGSGAGAPGMSRFTHSICEECWKKKNPRRSPVRIIDCPPMEKCCFCSKSHYSGIYVRENPADMQCNGVHTRSA